MLSLPRFGSFPSISRIECSDPAAAGGFKACRRDGTGLAIGRKLLCGRLGVAWTIRGGVNRSPEGFHVPLLARRTVMRMWSMRSSLRMGLSISLMLRSTILHHIFISSSGISLSAGGFGTFTSFLGSIGTTLGSTFFLFEEAILQLSPIFSSAATRRWFISDSSLAFSVATSATLFRFLVDFGGFKSTTLSSSLTGFDVHDDFPFPFFFSVFQFLVEV